jgi:type I restriction enzyme R subunit
MLVESGAGSEADVARANEEFYELGLFIRSLVGLDRKAATAAFDRYRSDGAYSVNQIRFVQLIVEHLTANGVMEVGRFYESPFTGSAPHGPDSIFTEDDVDGIVTVLHQVRERALPDVTVA